MRVGGVRLGKQSPGQIYPSQRIATPQVPVGVIGTLPEGIIRRVTFFDDKRYPVARDIAVPDEEVHPNYWRKPQGSNIVFKTPRALEPGKVQPIGFTGDPEKPEEMGTSKNPNFTHSWDGGLSTQLSTNGGSKRPSLKWTLGDPIDRTRMIVPTETLRAASLDEASYLAIAKKHFCTVGVPSCTGSLVALLQE